VLVPRETPLNLIHLENMHRLALAGAILLPPVITMYTKPRGIDDLVDHIVGKVLDALDIEREAER
jgi:4-hydroxy-3-polyprenylbenzoate decarboxylase